MTDPVNRRYLHLDNGVFELHSEEDDPFGRLVNAMNAAGDRRAVELRVILRNARDEEHEAKLLVNCAVVRTAYVVDFPDRPISYV